MTDAVRGDTDSLLFERLLSYIGGTGRDFLRSLMARYCGAEQPAAPKTDVTGAAPSEPPKPVLNSGTAWAVLASVDGYYDSGLSPLHVCVSDATALARLLSPAYTAVRLMTGKTLCQDRMKSPPISGLKSPFFIVRKVRSSSSSIRSLHLLAVG